MFKLPISMRTMALEARKRELEQKLLDIEKAVRTFSAKEVFVAL